jgi:hypothetical protein
MEEAPLPPNASSATNTTMKNRLTPKKSLRTRTRVTTKLILAAGTVGLSLILVAGWMVYMNFQQLNEIKASDNGQKAAGGSLNGGEIILEFTWEKNPVTLATLGPDGISCGNGAESINGGKSSTGGLSAGTKGKDIDLTLEGTPYLNVEGIDVSLDYRGRESDGYFIVRENTFAFGIEKGMLSISYKTENEKGQNIQIHERTDYEVVQDGTYRKYRFIYSPLTGVGEISVNGAPVWNHKGTPDRAMSWKNAGNLIIAKGMNGNGDHRAIMDNLVIRSTGSVSPLAESLVNFMLESSTDKINIHFEAIHEDMISSFIIERSLNGIDFSKVSSLSPDENKKINDEYVVTDPAPANNGILYYRIKQHFKNGKFIIHPVSAIRMKTEKAFSLERINPSPFNSTFNIAYFIPKPGRVWIQLNDQKGTLLDSQTFEAGAGKNVHISKNYGHFPSGTYTVNIMYDNKKISERVIKI